jgi:UMF1 family MFS transporter
MASRNRRGGVLRGERGLALSDTTMRKPGRAAIGAWLLFDWAAQPYFTLVTTFVFAPYFAARVAASPVEGQALWGYATAAAGIIIAVLSPCLGSIADAGGRRKPWIAAFSVLLVAGSLALWFAEAGTAHAVAIALVAFAIGTVGAEFATVFNNAMMPDLVPEERLGRLSGTGWATGYVGGLLSLVIALGFLVADPVTGKTFFGLAPLFGLDPATFEGDRASGPFTAVWYLIFVTPLFLLTPDSPRRMALGAAVRKGLGELGRTVRDLRHHANIFRFLVAHMIYADGLVALFAFGGIYAAGTFGWTSIELGVFGILLTITGTIGALIGGRLDDRLGPKRVIAGALTILVLAIIGILSIDGNHIAFVIPVDGPAPGDGLFAAPGEKAYLVLGAIIGAVAGPMQSASRSLMARVSPRGSVTQFFGLFALSGKVTSFFGPLAVGVLTAVSGSQRIGISVLVVFFVAGGLVLLRVREVRG